MEKRKVRKLIQFYEGDEKCLTRAMLIFRRDRYHRLYEGLQEELKQRTPQSKGWKRTLRMLQKTHNKKRALKEVLQETDAIAKRKQENEAVDVRKLFKFNESSDFVRSCKKKIKYRVKSANEAALEVSANLGEKLESYKCRHCDGWHIGHAIV